MDIEVIVADDFPLVRDGVVQALREEPRIRVVGEATTGPEALALTCELRPDVLLLDLRMPGMSGQEVLERVMIDVPAVRVLVMSASERAESVLDAVAAGAAGYLSKRTGAGELCRAVVTAQAGGSVVSSMLAGRLLRELSDARTEPRRGSGELAGREMEVLRMVASGMTDAQIAGALFVSPRTVQNHLARIRARTGLRRRAELTRWAVEHALL